MFQNKKSERMTHVRHTNEADIKSMAHAMREC